MPVELPKASRNQEDVLKTQTIEIDREGHIYLNSQPLLLDDLRIVLRSLDKSIPILIRADKNINLQSFVDVLDIVKNLGFKKVGLQTEEKK